MISSLAEKINDSFHPSQDTGTFFTVPNWLSQRTELSFGAKVLYGRLRQYAGKDHQVFPKIPTLAKEIGCCVRTVSTLLAELKKYSLIRTVRRGLGKSNRYEFIPHIWMKHFPQEVTGSSGPAEPCIPDMQNPANHSLKENCKRKTTATPVVVVSSVDNDPPPESAKETSGLIPVTMPNSQQMDECLSAVPADIPRTDSLKRLIRRFLAKSGLSRVKDNIAYVNAVTLRKRTAYKAYLNKALSENYAEDRRAELAQEEKTVRQVTQKAVQADIQTKQEIMRGLEQDRHRAELAEHFLSMPETGREEIRQAYLSGCNAFILRKVRHLDHTGLARSLGFRLFLEGGNGQ